MWGKTKDKSCLNPFVWPWYQPEDGAIRHGIGLAKYKHMLSTSLIIYNYDFTISHGFLLLFSLTVFKTIESVRTLQESTAGAPWVFHLKTKVKLICVIIFHCVCIQLNESYRLILVKAWSIWHTTSRFFTYLKNTEWKRERLFPKGHFQPSFSHPVSFFLMVLCMWDLRKGQSLSALSWLTTLKQM